MRLSGFTEDAGFRKDWDQFDVYLNGELIECFVVADEELQYVELYHHTKEGLYSKIVPGNVIIERRNKQ